MYIFFFTCTLHKETYKQEAQEALSRSPEKHVLHVHLHKIL